MTTSFGPTEVSDAVIFFPDGTPYLLNGYAQRSVMLAHTLR
jgi:hypothetical protein